MITRSHRPSPALVISVIALVMAMTGIGWAVARNSVGTKQLKRHAVTASKLHPNAVKSSTVKNNSLLLKDIKDGELSGGLLRRGPPTSFRLAPTSPVTSTATISFTVPTGRTLLLSDVLFQNPASDLGRVRLQRDGAPLVELNLQSFSTQHHRFTTPLAFSGGQKVQLFIDCDNPSGGCTPAGLFSGVLEN